MNFLNVYYINAMTFKVSFLNYQAMHAFIHLTTNVECPLYIGCWLLKFNVKQNTYLSSWNLKSNLEAKD